MCGDAGRFIFPGSDDRLAWLDHQDISGGGVMVGKCSSRKLDDAVGPPRGGDTPWLDGSAGFEDPAISRNEGDVYRESHEEGVHGIGRRDHHGRPVRQRLMFQQTRAPAL